MLAIAGQTDGPNGLKCRGFFFKNQNIFKSNCFYFKIKKSTDTLACFK